MRAYFLFFCLTTLAIKVTATPFWLSQIKHEGTSPFYSNGGATWKVFRNVKDYGAKGDGVHDDSDAIQNAIIDGNRNSHGGGVTGEPALVFLPAGTYRITKPLYLLLQTVIVGNPLDKAVIKPTNSVGANYVIDANDHSTQGTNNFYISIRNIKIDTTGMKTTINVKALNWGVSQGSCLSNVDIVMPYGNTAHEGIVMVDYENAGLSNTMFGDLTITGGNIGIAVSGQQLLIKSITFFGCRTGIKILNHQLMVLQDLTFEKCGTGIDNTTPATGLYLIDSFATNCGPVLITDNTESAWGSVLVENLQNTGGERISIMIGNTNVLGHVNTWAHGNVYGNAAGSTAHYFRHAMNLPTTKRPAALLRSDGTIYVKQMPQYGNIPASSFASVKSFGAKGDGKTDDTAAIRRALAANVRNKVTYFPHGVYLVTGTITVPPGSRLVGEVWSVISGHGSYFFNANDPKPVMRIGAPGSVGQAELTDLLITISDVLPGAILVEINMAGVNPGDVSLHNTLMRVGGTADSKVNNVCNTTPAKCKAAFLMLHVTTSASAYLEGLWGWTADHSLEVSPQGNWGSVYVATGRGFLIESTKATWMMGVAPEHQALYGLNINQARNLYIAMAEIETPYWQPSPPPSPHLHAPSPWTAIAKYGDPSFYNCNGNAPNCYKAWGMRVNGGSHILVYGIGIWTFFDDFNGDWSNSKWSECSSDSSAYCQQNGIQIQGNPTNSYFYGLATKKIRNMVITNVGGNVKVLAKQADNEGGWGGHIVAYLGFS